MLSLTRETLLEHLDDVHDLVTRYTRRETFLEEVINWMLALEKSLQRMRSPLSSFVASQRGLIMATFDGYRDPAISAESLKLRKKAERATTMIILNRVSEVLGQRVNDVDNELSALREKMVSFIAAASVKQPLPLPPREPRDQWLVEVWDILGRDQTTLTLYTYLNGSLSKQDRLYLLNDILVDLLSAQDCESS